MQTLITGFGAFGRVVDNPSERLARLFEREPCPGHDVTACVLPVSYARAPQAMRAMIEAGGRAGGAFDNILMLGVADRSPGWRVERFGTNRNGNKADVEDFTPPEQIVASPELEQLPVSFSVERLVQGIEAAGLPAFSSDSAGLYLCNHVLFTTLHHLRVTGAATRAGFLHVPADEQTFSTDENPTTPIFPFAQHREAVCAVLAVLAEPEY